MSFDDLIKQGQSSETVPVFDIIDGSFGCDFCWEQIDQAEYYRSEKRLIFRHGEHETIIEGFVI